MSNLPRVAFFADTFHEVNGAANVIRRLVSYAEENDYPMLCIRAGAETRYEEKGSLATLELKRGKLSVPIDCDLKYDPLLWRYKKLVGEKLKEFNPDIIHVTGLNDISQLGFYFAHFRNINAVASWHTNTHEYAARRLTCLLNWLPCPMRQAITGKVERGIMFGLMKLYFLAQMQLAPNEELVTQIRALTHRPSFLMSRGVDTRHFHPDKRSISSNGSVNNGNGNLFTLGYVGRLRPEKNVRFLGELDKALQTAGLDNYKFVIIGEGSETDWLKQNIRNAHLTGVLRGEDLARKYAEMDLFVFPSKTDAFGNVVLEAMAAGVPALVMPENGPKFLIDHKKNGYVAANDEDFINAGVRLVNEPRTVQNMKVLARQAACERSWERVFDSVYEVYQNATMVTKKVRV